MTPLHCIISNSQKLLEQLKIIKDGTNLSNRKIASSSKRSHRKIQSLVDFFDEGRELTENILYSSQIMHFYNLNQLEIMNIKKGTINLLTDKTQNPEKFIKEIVKPFESQIKQKNIKVEFRRVAPIEYSIITDWKMYKLALFNVL